MLHQPFYHPQKSYEENYEKGPFGVLSDGKKYKEKKEPKHDFLGEKVHLPFGIPAGPVINSNFVKGAFEKGFDLLVYKTVRSASFPCHPFPNVLAVKTSGDLTEEKLTQPLVADSIYQHPISITNSFGVPSRDPQEWKNDFQKALTHQRKGQVLILSFMGTVKKNQTEEEFIEDHAFAAKRAKETGARIFEVNLSCPNIGNEGLVCYNLQTTEKVAKKVRSVIGNSLLILKVGHYKNQKDIEKLAEIAEKHAQGIAAINTLQAQIIDKEGKQALPGKSRSRSGVCGAGIKWAGLEMTKKLSDIRAKNNYRYKIIGIGGVIKKEDYFEYRNQGADAVMSATGAMWNPYLAQEIKKQI